MIYHMTLIPAHTPTMRYMALTEKVDAFRQEEDDYKKME